MKKRAVYSIYIDVPEKEHYANASDMLLNKNDIKVKKTRDNFIAHYQKLLDNKKAYCDSIGVPFFFYENDNEYKDYLKMFANYQLIESSVLEYGFQTVDEFNSELMVLKKTEE